MYVCVYTLVVVVFGDKVVFHLGVAKSHISCGLSPTVGEC